MSLRIDIARMYTEGLYDRHKYLATWLPGAPVRLGDRGILAGRLWAREGTIPGELLAAGVRDGPTMPLLEWQNTTNFTFETKLAGHLAPTFTSLAEADSGLAYTFDRGGGVLFKANDITVHEIDDSFAIRHWMLTEHRAGRLPENTLVVTRVLRARVCMILVSESHGARVEMRTSAKVGERSQDMVALHGDTVVTRATGMYTSVVLSQNSTPLFGGLGYAAGFYKDHALKICFSATIRVLTARGATFPRR